MHLWRIRSALSSATPALTMLGTLGLAAWLSRSSSPSDGIFAFAQADTEMVAAVEVGRVASIEVDVGDVVAPGQVIVALDSGAIDAELAVARAEEARLRAMIPAEHARLDQELEAGVEELKLELAREVEEQRRARAEGEVLASEISRVKQLIEDKQASHDALGSLDVQRAGVEAIATEKPRTIQLLRAQIAAAEERRKRLLQQAGPETAKIEADLAVTRREIEQLEALRAQHTLRAAHGGRVSAVRKRPGDVAVAGDPIVEIASAPGRVIACVPERAALHVEAGDAATIWARGQDGAPLTGRAVTVGPVVGQLPLRCWTDLNVPVWGREVTIALDHPVELLAGQAFDVAFKRAAAPLPAPPAPGAPAAPAAQGAPAAAAPPAGAADTIRMAVPAALRQRSRFEPSGVLPRPAEGRYLIVSDDTGHKDAEDEGVPWLFAMSAAGAVDPEPVPVHGVKELADIESITAGDGGDVYLLSSQGYSAKGKRKKARTALLRLKQDGRGFRVDAEVHLAELLDAAGPAALAELGLPGGTRPLEIEGMAYRDGALYFGLKSPLDAEGNALIWRLGAPRALLEGRRLEGAGLSLWARARVDVDLNGAPTPGGISDLCFLPDGSLAIASTPSTADGAAGSLFHVLRPEGGVLSPSLVRRFPGQKPEGISLALSPGKLIVVFDAGAEAPSFLELPWQG
ncbi:esterase-like activity of phytase family protein [Sorangium sp. So ce341]|uniref:esterase-like activity of phytase family protein n=1 Tax=Sorangium sp. So ce341 TaxID=3133302 RepID=UPI003F607F1F